MNGKEYRYGHVRDFRRTKIFKEERLRKVAYTKNRFDETRISKWAEMTKCREIGQILSNLLYLGLVLLSIFE